MKKIFYTDKSAYTSSEEAIQYLLKKTFGIVDAHILKTDNGKPYLSNTQDVPLFFSVSHTKNLLFIAFSKENIGIDAEYTTRHIHYAPIIKKFPSIEQNEIHSTADFLQHWLAKESTIKWLGGSIAKDLNNLAFFKNQIYYNESPLPVHITFEKYDDTILAICSETPWEELKIHPFP